MSRLLRALICAGMSATFLACEAELSPSPSARPRPTGTPLIVPTLPPATPFVWERAEPGPDGGEVTVGVLDDIRQLNPYTVSNPAELAVKGATWASVYLLTDDFRYAPDLSFDVPTIDNGGVQAPGSGRDAMTVTWRLKPGLRWSDGAPLTCDDFRYAWEWVLDPQNTRVSKVGWGLVTDVECPDPQRVVVHFGAIYEGYFSLLTAPMPRHYLAAIPMADQLSGVGFGPADFDHLPVSGAFGVESWQPGVELTLARNESYRSFATGLPPHLERIVIRSFEDSTTLIEAFLAGEVDAALGFDVADVAKMVDRGLGLEIASTSDIRTEVLRMNWGSTAIGSGGCSRGAVVEARGPGCPTADLAIREAMALAIDKERIIDDILDGNVQAASGGIAPAAWFYSEQAPRNPDIDQARETLAAGGWVDVDGDGTRERNGLRAVLELCTVGGESRIAVANLIAAMLEPAGIQVHVSSASARDMFAAHGDATEDTPCALSRGNFDLALGESDGSIDPIFAYTSFHTSQAPPVGRNWARISDPELDEELEIVAGTVDFTEIKAAMARFQERYQKIAAELPIYYPSKIELSSGTIGNFFPSSVYVSTWNVADWFIRD